MMPLTMAEMGQKKLIKQINGKDDTRKFLENLGFVEGAEVSVVAELAGNMIINVKDSRIALGKSMANRIIV
ncbi:MAG TPA: ferrous iron transport protein A [Candidatus Aphodoplasma excrementigallinarum]|uniref:Ferrous iron transport protein A n=1 Tax=Candidatus Aphodoplasma excrementigallinarum TaxID=2840673 RepID=A0A9D1T0R8_9FIRM|nr:ferrous iron transport protein A [Candidatus Aphodoplasma excrementigallinarum]